MAATTSSSGKCFAAKLSTSRGQTCFICGAVDMVEVVLNRFLLLSIEGSLSMRASLASTLAMSVQCMLARSTGQIA